MRIILRMKVLDDDLICVDVLMMDDDEITMILNNVKQLRIMINYVDDFVEDLNDDF